MNTNSIDVEEIIQILINDNDQTFQAFDYLKYKVSGARKIFLLINKHLSSLLQEHAIREKLPIDFYSLYTVSYTQSSKLRAYLLENLHDHFIKAIDFINFLLKRYLMGTNNKSVNVFRYIEKNFKRFIFPNPKVPSLADVCVPTPLKKSFPPDPVSLPSSLSSFDIEEEIEKELSILNRKRTFRSFFSAVSSSSLDKKPRTITKPEPEPELDVQEATSWIDTILS